MPQPIPNGLPPSESSGSSSNIILPELLGHQPQFILDDIFNVAQDAVISTVEAMQVYLERWAERRSERLKAQGESDWDGAEEIEQGLVSLQTLLDSHVDLSFDFFEMWALRSIFRVPEEARPVVLPHQRGLDLDIKPEKEAELLSEIEELRKRLDDMNRLHTLYSAAVRASEQQLVRSEARRAQLAFLANPSRQEALQSLADLPSQLGDLSKALRKMPDEESIRASAGWERRAAEHEMRAAYGRQEWEERGGYEAWALERAAASALSTDAEEGADVSAIEERETRRAAQERIGHATSALALVQAMES